MNDHCLETTNHPWITLLFHASVSCTLESALFTEIKCYKSFNWKYNQNCLLFHMEFV